MAKNNSAPRSSLRQRIDESLTRRAKSMDAPIPKVNIGRVDVIAQAEIVNVLRIRAQLNELKEELQHAQRDLLNRLEDCAEVQYGFYTMVSENMQLRIWESDSTLEL
jgi:hypothetical protein